MVDNKRTCVLTTLLVFLDWECIFFLGFWRRCSPVSRQKHLQTLRHTHTCRNICILRDFPENWGIGHLISFLYVFDEARINVWTHRSFLVHGLIWIVGWIKLFKTSCHVALAERKANVLDTWMYLHFHKKMQMGILLKTHKSFTNLIFGFGDSAQTTSLSEDHPWFFFSPFCYYSISSLWTERPK